MHRTEYGHTRIMLHFGTCESMFNTLGIISSEFWYIWFTLAHFTFGTPVGTLSVMVVILLVHQAAFWHTRIVLVYFGYDWYTVDVNYV